MLHFTQSRVPTGEHPENIIISHGKAWACAAQHTSFHASLVRSFVCAGKLKRKTNAKH